MPIEVTDEAIEVFKRSLQLAGVEGEGSGVRLRGSKGLGGGFDVQVELAEGQLEGEERLECSDVNVYVDPSINQAFPHAIVAVEPQHETVVVRPVEPR